MGGKWVGGRLVGRKKEGKEEGKWVRSTLVGRKKEGKEVRGMSIRSQKKTGRRGKRDQKWIGGTLVGGERS